MSDSSQDSKVSVSPAPSQAVVENTVEAQELVTEIMSSAPVMSVEDRERLKDLTSRIRENVTFSWVGSEQVERLRRPITHVPAELRAHVSHFCALHQTANCLSLAVSFDESKQRVLASPRLLDELQQRIEEHESLLGMAISRASGEQGEWRLGLETRKRMLGDSLKSLTDLRALLGEKHLDTRLDVLHVRHCGSGPHYDDDVVKLLSLGAKQYWNIATDMMSALGAVVGLRPPQREVGDPGERDTALSTGSQDEDEQ